MPSVSVVVPTCNRAHMIEKAINSVLNQTFEDLELIVVDDCSEDETAEVVEQIKDPRLKFFRQTERKGAAEARNAGVAVSSGKYLAFLDDDDEWLPDKLQRQLEVFKTDPEMGMVYSGYYYVNAENNEIYREFQPSWRGKLDDLLLMENCIGTTSSAVVGRDCFNQVGGFDVSLPSSQDWDLWIRIAQVRPIDYVSCPLVKFLNHDARITHNMGSKIQGKVKLLKKIMPLVQNKPKVLSHHYFVIGFLYCAKGDVENGKKNLLAAIKKNPVNFRCYKHYLAALPGGSFYRYLSSKKNRYLISKNSN
ncbi:MAG: glycosyltransferase family 2 protein [Syntrophotaleaceae bacterium]